MGRSASKHVTVDTRSGVLTISDGKSKSKSFPTGSIVRMSSTKAATIIIHIADKSHNHQGRVKTVTFRSGAEREAFIQAVTDANAMTGARTPAAKAGHNAPKTDILSRQGGQPVPAGQGGEMIALLPGESVQLTDNGVGVLHDTLHGISLIRGSLQLTTYRLIFSTYQSDETEMGGQQESLQLQVELMLIDRLERPQREPLHVLVHTKNLRVLHLVMPSDEAFRQLSSALVQFAFPIRDEARGPNWSPASMFFAFSYSVADGNRGWEVYDFQAELERQRVRRDTRWRVIDNSSFELSPTYPPYFVVPASVSDADLRKVAAFRSRARLPALAWVHPSTGAALCRSAQPLAGVLAKRCREDEALMQQFQQTAHSNGGLLFVDARGALAAGGNKAKGKGTESTSNYSNSSLHYCDIANIHRVREAYQKLGALCQHANDTGSDDGNWLSQLERTRWLKVLSNIVAGAKVIVRSLQEGRSVLCHCSDGWDRTPQLTSLAMLMMDPYYRTLRGFQVLVEKEWIAFGHKFEHRLGQGNSNHADEERSPVFVQWLDSVYQVWRQFPTAFEFNEALLLTVADHAYSARYGNFLFNTERERTAYRVRETSVSLWADVNACATMFCNPLYVPVPADSPPLLPSEKQKHMRLWEAFFLRWDPFTPNPLFSSEQSDEQASAVRDNVRAHRASMLPSDMTFAPLRRMRSATTGGSGGSVGVASVMLNDVLGRADRDPHDVATKLRSQNHIMQSKLARAEAELKLLRQYADKMRRLEVLLTGPEGLAAAAAAPARHSLRSVQ